MVRRGLLAVNKGSAKSPETLEGSSNEG